MTATAGGAGQTDNAFVRQVLWDVLPESREKILSLEQKELEIFGPESDGQASEVGAYTLASVAFVGAVLRPLLTEAHPDEEVARRCADAIECLLGSDRPGVREMVSIRITDYLLGYVEPWLVFKKYAGPLLRSEVGERKQYYTGPF